MILAWEKKCVSEIHDAAAELLAAENYAQEYLGRARLRNALAALRDEAAKRVAKTNATEAQARR